MLAAQLNKDEDIEELREFVDILQANKSKHTSYKGIAFIGKLQGDFKQYSCNVDNVLSRLEQYIGEDNIYITPNVFKGFTRTQDTLWQLKFLYMDLDVLKDTKLSINQAYGELMDLAENNIIPYPTMVINTGRGLQVYWSIGDYVANKINISFWKDVQKCLYSRLEHLGADKKVTTDTARVLRIPTCYNSKNNAKASIWYSNKFNTYKLADLKEEYFKEELTYKPKKTKPQSTTIKSKRLRTTKNIKHLEEVKTPYTLHRARVRDILKVLSLRGFDLPEGNRNETLFILAYHYVMVKDVNQDQLYSFIRGVNGELIDPLPNGELNGIVKSAYKYYLKFKEEKEKNKVSRNVCLNNVVSLDNGTSSTYPYSYLVYSNKAIMEVLGISKKEMEQLDTLIDSEEKNRRDKERKKAQRRGGDVNGLTEREQKKKDTYNSIQELKAKGLKQSEVATQLAVGIATVKRHWKTDTNI